MIVSKQVSKKKVAEDKTVYCADNKKNYFLLVDMQI